MIESSRVRSSKTVDVHVGERLRMRRLTLKMSQEKLASALGLTFQQVQKYEKGSNRIGAGRLFQLAKILGVNVQFFFEGLVASEEPEAIDTSDSAHSSNGDNLNEFLKSREAVELNRAFLRVGNPKSRGAILKFVRTLGQLQT